MQFGKKTLFSFLLGLALLTNVLEFAHVNFLSLTTLVSFCTYTLLPGLLISLILRLRKISFWENLLIIVGLSLAFLQCGGLLLNILLPLIGIKDPLAFQNIVIGFDVYMALLFLFAWIRTKPSLVKISEQLDLNKGSSPTRQSQTRQFAKPNFITSNYSEQLDLNKGSSPTRQSQTRQFAKPNFITSNYKALANLDTHPSMPITAPKIPNSEKVLYVLPIFFPILATLGAIVINNGGSNILTLVLFGSIAFYSLLLVIFHKKISPNLYPYAIFFIALACLFTISLRSWYITGHDITTEFHVFQLTNTHHIWKMAFYQDPYNACLSITILPTVLTHLLSVKDIHVYKVIFQILFATSPVMVFFIIRNYATPILAFLSTLIFISFPTFLIDMPMLNRQEIGFIFFGLVLYMLLLSKLSFPTRRILFVLFGLGVITSHYSTNFILLALVVFVYVLIRIISLPFVKKALALVLSKSHIRPRIIFHHQAFLSLPLVSILFVTTFLWNTVYTNSSSHAGSVIERVVRNVLAPSSDNSQSIGATYSLFSPKPDPEQVLQEYIQSSLQSSKANKPESINQLYKKTITSKYPTDLLSQEKLAPTPLGIWLSSLHIPVFHIHTGLAKIFSNFIHIFSALGVLFIIFFNRKRDFDIQYLLLCLGSIILIGLIIILPGLSVDYGEMRMLEQLLFILSLPILLCLNSVLFFVKEQKRIIFTGIIATFFFLNSTGFIAHLTGDYYPQFSLDNAGLYYDAYYTHKSDIMAIAWVSSNNVKHQVVETDRADVIKLRAYAKIEALNALFPQVIRKDAYVYLPSNDKVVAFVATNTLIYNSPKPFLDDNKNLIYSNGKNYIYK